MDLSKITKYIPEFTLRDFTMFDTVTYVEWKKALNNETGIEEATFFITMQCDKGYEVSLKFVNSHGVAIDLSEQIAGFCIDDMTEYGYLPENRYCVRDYEEDCISLYCEDVLVERFTKLW